MKERNVSIDIMRFVGILLIILAHVKPPHLLFEIRDFDVPMMVFISGASYFLSKKRAQGVFSYVLSRFVRLVLPVWFFLTFFFTFIYLFKPIGFYDLINAKTILSTFSLNGFGYVWVIRIFLLIAILAPVYTLLLEKISMKLVPIILLLVMLFVTYFSLHIQTFNNRVADNIIFNLLLPIMSYGVMFIFGYLCIKNNVISGISIWCVFSCAFVFCFLYGYFNLGLGLSPQEFKYPPSLYYISYSIFITFPLFILVKWAFRSQPHKIISFISSNTIWIYLWHIPIVEFFIRGNVGYSFFYKYIFAVSVSVSIAMTQVAIVNKLVKLNPNRLGFLKSIFTG